MVQQDTLPDIVNKNGKYDADKKLSISYCRARLGKTADGKTDEEILKIRNLMYKFLQATYAAHKYSYNNNYENISR
jgi:hypothetical protein